MKKRNEDELLRSVALRDAKSIMLERQRAEEELVRAKEFHDVVMSNMAEGLFALDHQGLLTYLNPAAERLFGWTSAELLGRRMHDVIHYKRPDGAPFPVEECPAFRVLSEGKVSKDNDDVFIKKDGSSFPVTFSSSPIRSNDRVVGSIVVFRDTTERRHIEEAQHHLAAVVASSDDAIVSKDLNGIIRSWNAAAERIFGYTSDEIVGKLITAIIPLERLNEEEEILRRLRSGERVDHFDTVRVHKEGRRVYVSVTISPIRNSKGQIIGASKIARDITNRKKLEMTSRFLNEASAVLAEVTDYESTLQKVAGLAVPSFADWCAVDMKDTGESVRRLAVMHADAAKLQLTRELEQRYPSRPADLFGLMKVLRTGKPDWVEAIPESLLQNLAQDQDHLQLLRKLGLRSYICVPLRSRTKTIGALTFATAESGRVYDVNDLQAAVDLAHRTVIAIENAQLLTALQDSDKRKDEFLAMLAHELRNPLAPIRNSLEALRIHGPAHPELQWSCNVIDRQVQQLTRLVDDLLDVSRVSRGKIALQLEPIDLAGILSSAIEISRPLIDARKHRLEVSVLEQAIWVEGDSTRLAQVVSNLLNNAAKYTELGGRIWLILQAEAGEAVIRVRDTGVGLASEVLTRVFEMFTQLQGSASRAEGGLGIGLSLVRRLVEMHGGTVQVFSEGLGKGSEFVVRLPRLQEAPSPASMRNTAPRPERAPPRRILVVDDNKDAAESLAMLLRIAGHDVALAYDGPIALELARKQRPDVVLCDIGLPHMDGYEVARRLRQDLGLTNALLVALTGYGMKEDKRRSQEAGFNAHFVKPMNVDVLNDLMSRSASQRSASLLHGASRQKPDRAK